MVAYLHCGKFSHRDVTAQLLTGTHASYLVLLDIVIFGTNTFA